MKRERPRIRERRQRSSLSRWRSWLRDLLCEHTGKRRRRSLSVPVDLRSPNDPLRPVRWAGLCVARGTKLVLFVSFFFFYACSYSARFSFSRRGSDRVTSLAKQKQSSSIIIKARARACSLVDSRTEDNIVCHWFLSGRSDIQRSRIHNFILGEVRAESKPDGRILVAESSKRRSLPHIRSHVNTERFLLPRSFPMIATRSLWISKGSLP